MNIKKLIATVLTGASLLVFAGIASATVDTPGYDINIYGSSAQYSFWNTVAPAFIKAQTGCTSVTPSVATQGGVNTITYATCGGNTYHIRVSNKASFDGVYSMLDNDSYATAGATGEKCVPGDPNYPSNASQEGYYRQMVQTDGTLACEPVMIGASDVAGESFTQLSSGSLNGVDSAPGTNLMGRSFNGISTTSLTHANPFVVPFAFYVNNQVTQSGSTISNLTRMEAVLLFSGQILNWNQLGAHFINLPVVVCMRHAGSGTLATLDYAVVYGNGWGSQLLQYENRPDYAAEYDPTSVAVYFGDTTGNEEDCVNTNTFGGTAYGAVGYFDADKIGLNTNHTVNNFANLVQVSYNGEYASADAIQNGRYDFWTNEWLYKSPILTSTQLADVNALISYATTAALPASEVPFWVLQSNMNVEKPNDQTYPNYQ